MFWRLDSVPPLSHHVAMNGGFRGRVDAVLLVLALALTMSAPLAVAEPAIAKEKAPACPRKIGGFKVDGSRIGDNVVDCYYTTKNWNARDGHITLAVFWRPDTPDERAQCDYRNPPPLDPSGGGTYHGTLFRTDRAAYGNYHLTEGRRIKRAQAEAALRKLIKRAVPLAHPCIPEPLAEDVLACPLVVGDMFVRRDWYGGDAPAVETGRSEAAATEYSLECDYRHAYRDDSQSGNTSLDLRINWWEGDLEDYLVGSYCSAQHDDSGQDTYFRDGVHPLEVRIDNEFAAAGGQELADRLASLAAARTQLCPGASVPEPAPGDVDAPVAGTTTSIVLSGGPGDEPPAVGTTMAMPEDDQHRIVIGGLDGEVIREEFLGDEATIVGYGPIATDADGNWAVSVEVDVSVAVQPTVATSPSPAPSVHSSTPAASAEPSVVPVASDEPTAAPTVQPAPTVSPASTAEPTITPAEEPTSDAEATPEPASSPTPVPPPQMIGMPAALTDYVAGLEPEAAGVVRDLTDYLGWLGDDIVVTGQGEVTVPASAIAALRTLAPELVGKIRLVPGGFIVESYVDILVTPVIGEDGLIEFRTNRLPDKIRSHEIVRALVMALNNYVVESGGRFRTISVTPEGLTVTAERRAED